MPENVNGSAAERTPAPAVPSTGAAKPKAPLRRLWEYKVETHSADPAELERVLNEKGAAGWRLASTHYFFGARGNARTAPSDPKCLAVFERRRRAVAPLSEEAAALERAVAVPGYIECAHAYFEVRPTPCACPPTCACRHSDAVDGCGAAATTPARQPRRR